MPPVAHHYERNTNVAVSKNCGKGSTCQATDPWLPIEHTEE